MTTALQTTSGAQQDSRHSLVETMAAHYSLKPADFFEAVKATAFSGKGTKAEMISFLVIADQYKLNPFTKEIYAFQKKGGGIQPVVSVDGWYTIINSHPQMDGMEFIEHADDRGALLSVTCKIYRKDRSRPSEATEHMAECAMPTDPWRKWPRRMLRHKAAIQAARIAFGFAGIIDPDEAERLSSVNLGAVPRKPAGTVNDLLESIPEAPTPVDDSDGFTIEHDDSHGDHTTDAHGEVIEQGDEPEPTELDPMEAEIQSLAQLAIAHDCPKDEAEKYARQALDQEQPAGWLGQKPWAKGKAKQQSTV